MAFWKKRQKKQPPVQPPPAVERLLSYQVANLQGIGARARQEDAFAFVNAMDVSAMKQRGLLAIVADGMGGMEDGSLASGTAIAALKESFETMDRGNLAEELRAAVTEAGERVFRALGGSGGSTLIACVLFEEKLYFASVGDSYLYLLRDGALYRLNRPHNVRQEIWLDTLRQGSMDPQPGECHREAEALTQFLGMPELEDVDYLHRPLALRDGDLLLICSDGVAGVLGETELRDCLLEGTPPEMCARLEEAICLQNREFQDNYTALVLRCGY